MVPDIEVDSLVINPIEPNIIYALSHDGIYISVNAGQSWAKPIDSFYLDLIPLLLTRRSQQYYMQLSIVTNTKA